MFNFIIFAAILFAVNGHYGEEPKSFKDAQCDVLGICVVCTIIFKNFLIYTTKITQNNYATN